MTPPFSPFVPTRANHAIGLTAVKDATRRWRGGLRPSLTAAPRDGLPGRRSGRRDGQAANRTKG